MKRSLKVFLLAVMVLVFMTTVVFAIGNYKIDWWTVDGGGFSQSAGGQYTLQGTIGQADAGASQGGEYGLAGGFWVGLREWVTQFFIHLPLVQR